MYVETYVKELTYMIMEVEVCKICHQQPGDPGELKFQFDSKGRKKTAQNNEGRRRSLLVFFVCEV